MMGLFSRIFQSKDKSALSRRPDFERAPWVDVDFSGTAIKFRDPKHTGAYPLDYHPHDLDIYEVSNYHQWGSSLAKRFYVKGWNFWASSIKKTVGGVDVKGFLYQYFSNGPKNFNAFRKKDIGNDILGFCHELWGEENKAKEKGDIGSGYYQYPVTLEELQFIEINGATCCLVKTECKGRPPEYSYFFPITSKHILSLFFIHNAYDPHDYFDPTLNIEQMCESVREEFMENFHITLSDEATKMKRESASG